MAKGNRTTSTPRRATAAKATKAGPVEWGYENGRHVVVRATGRFGRQLPIAQWQGMRTAIADLQDVADAINALREYPASDMAAPLAVIAVQSVSLIGQLANCARHVLDMSPTLRADLAGSDACMAAARAKAKGGAL